MALVPAKCTNCGHVLQVENSKNEYLCPCCNSIFILEKATNNYNSTMLNNINGPIININDTDNYKEFEYKTFEVLRANEKDKINYMRKFGYFLKSSTPSGVTTTKLVFKRNTKMKGYNRLLELEIEYEKLSTGTLPLYIVGKYTFWTIFVAFFGLILIISFLFALIESTSEDTFSLIFGMLLFTLIAIILIISFQKRKKKTILENERRTKYNNSIPEKIKQIEKELNDIITNNENNNYMSNIDKVNTIISNTSHSNEKDNQVFEKLKQLKILLDDGIITQNEYDIKKNELMNKI